MLMDKELKKDLGLWKKTLNLTNSEIKLIKKHIKGMKMEEFRNLMDIVTVKPNGEKINLWFNRDTFTPVTLSIYYLNIRSLKFLLEEVWGTSNSNRTRTTSIIAALPEQKVIYAKKYNFIHSERQGRKCPNYNVYEKKKRNALF